MLSKDKKYQTVNLPVPLIDEIKRIRERYGYVSVLEFVKDSCRRRIEELRML